MPTQFNIHLVRLLRMAASMSFVIPPPPKAAFVIPPPPREVWQLDIETYRNYFLIKLFNVKRNEFLEFERYPAFDASDLPRDFDAASLAQMLKRVTIVTFNGNHYDVPMLSAALCGMSNNDLKNLSDAIITRGLKSWDIERTYGISPPDGLDHIDMIEVSPGVASLKMYGGKMHTKKMQDLPIEPAALITPAQRPLMREYCGNDLRVTAELYKYFGEQISLREFIGQRYGIDVRSKSDAQIAESVAKAQLGFIEKRFVPDGFTFKYQVPAFISFKTPQMQALLETVRNVSFVVRDKDQIDGEFDFNGEKVRTGVKMPTELKSAKITIGASTYKLGIGGLHSTESACYHVAASDEEISDHDVASYYPNIILKQGLFPHQMGPRFIEMYQGWTNERIAAKRAGKKKQADGEKTKINGTFGKLGSKYSIFFAPELLIQTTITGQLSLLMLIESLEMIPGVSVISANTDGIVIKCKKALGFIRDDIIKAWEVTTGFETECVRYQAIFSRDVNSYIAFKSPTEKEPDPKPKLKGAFAPPVPVGPSWPNPTGEICVDAVVAYLGKGTPIETTIRACRDIRKFVHIRNVKGGGVKYHGVEIATATTKSGKRKQLTDAGWRETSKDVFYHWQHGEFLLDQAHPHAVTWLREEYPVKKDYLGKAVRWYYAANEPGAIHYATNGNLVATTEGAKPCMELPDEFPNDVDYAKYIADAKNILLNFGLRCND